MRKVTEVEQTFEKYGIQSQGDEILFNQTFFLHSDDVQAEANINSYVMSETKNTQLFDSLTNLNGLKPFQWATRSLQHVVKTQPHDMYCPEPQSFTDEFVDLLKLLNCVGHFTGMNVTFYGSPHKGAQTLRIDVPSDVENPEAFVKKVQELYQANRRNVAYLNVTAVCCTVNGVDTLYRIMWSLNRLLLSACKDAENFVPGQVTLFTPRLTKLKTAKVVGHIDRYCGGLHTEYLLYANAETFSQWMHRLSRGGHQRPTLYTERLTQNIELVRRQLCEVLERRLTPDDYRDFTATWVLNNCEAGPTEHHTGHFIQLKRLYDESDKHLPFAKWVKACLKGDQEKGDTSAFTLAWDAHLKLHPGSVNDMSKFTQLLEELVQ